MSSDSFAAARTNGHRRTLGFCWIVYGIIRLVAAVWLIFFSSTATLMFGALLARVPNPFALMSDFHAVYIVAIVVAALSGIFGIVAGLSLLASQGAGRTLALVAGFLSLCDIPLGTTLGIYTLVIFLP